MKNNYLLVSTYSFDFFDSSINIDDLEFNSKLMCFNQKLDMIWEIKNVNVESILFIILEELKFLVIGTTRGKILFIEVNSGKIIAEIKKKSCINDLKFDYDSKTIFTCHDDGSLFAYFLGEI
jgi:WD40 repeat protein